MKFQHAYGICVIYVLVSQGFVHATLSIIDSLNRTLDTFKTREATAIDYVIEGYIEYANPPDACSEISLPNFPQNFTMKKIVLINGTTSCDIITKLQNAKQVGYDTAVLFDPFPGPFEYNLTFPLPVSEVNLSVVLVLCEDGIVIRDNYLYHIRDKDHFKIEIDANIAAWKIYLSYFLAAVAILILACFFGLFIFSGLIIAINMDSKTGICALIVIIPLTSIFILKCIWKTCVDMCGPVFQNPQEEQQNVVSDPLIRALLDVINEQNGAQRNEQNGVQRNEEECRAALSNLRRRCPSEVFSNDHPFEVCVICRYNFEVGEKIRKLPCFHAYHTPCIDRWLVYNKETCPMCVARVNLENSCEHSVPDPNESTPLLTTTRDVYSSFRTSNGSGPSNASIDESGELLAEAQGSVNNVHLNDSDDDDQRGLLAV